MERSAVLPQGFMGQTSKPQGIDRSPVHVCGGARTSQLDGVKFQGGSVRRNGLEAVTASGEPFGMIQRYPFRYFKTSPEIIRLAVMLYIRLPLSLRNVEGLLHERGIEISHETVHYWWNRFGPMFAAELPR